MRATTFCAVLFSLCLSLAVKLPGALAFDQDYLPLNAQSLSHRIHQTLVAESLQTGESIDFGRSKISISDKNMLEIRGSDCSSKPWYFVSHSDNGCASIWSSDLDKNGCNDLIIMMYNAGAAGNANCQLVILMFEKNGRPFPWAVDGFFEIDQRGIKDFIDMNHDGHAELVRQSKDDGYWITSIYQAGNARWHKVNSIDGVSFPLFTRFTTEPNHEAITPPAYRHPFESDLSNDCSNPLSSNKYRYIDEIVWQKPNTAQPPCLVLSDGQRNRPATWYGSLAVIIDEPSSRRIALYSANSASRKMLDEISCRRLPVAFSGKRQKGQHNLSSELVFAQSDSSNLAAFNSTAPKRKLDLALSNLELP